ncbi:MAG: fumarate/nitrate reduction transcriptional regulator Fnr [Pseudomonadota bacterium]
MDQNKQINLKEIKVVCKNCSLRQLCLPKLIDTADIKRLDDIIERKTSLKKGDYLFKQGDKFKSIYVVRSGSLKTYVSSLDGKEQIMGIHLPGELLGIDALSESVYSTCAKTLEVSNVCELPFDKVEMLSQKLPSLQHQLLSLMSKEVSNEYKTILFLGKKTAEERLATYLLSLSNRFKLRGFSPYEFHLSMSRGDIANYLNLAVETVSRMFTHFQKAKVLKCDKKKISILNMEQLEQLAGLPP